MIYPSIDLMNGKAVQLVQGKREQKKIEIDDVLGTARIFAGLGFEIQLIDLDAAMDNGSNIGIIETICRKFNCRVGGGIRTIAKAKEIIKAGAKKIIVGSKVFENGKINILFLKQLGKYIGKDNVIIAIDSKEGKIVVKGWKKSTGLDPVKTAKELEPYCSEFLYTYVDKEGMMQGTDYETLRKLKTITKNEITAAGGIASIEEIKKLERLGVNSVLGMAVYTGRIKLEELKGFKKEKHVFICPKCGSTDIKVDFSNPVVWIYGTRTMRQCASCGRIGAFFPEVLESEVNHYREELNIEKKQGRIKKSKEEQIDSTTGVFAIGAWFLGLMFIMGFILSIVGLTMLTKDKKTSLIFIAIGIFLLFSLFLMFRQPKKEKMQK